MFGTGIDYPIKQFEALLLNDIRVAVIHEMSVVERYSQAIHA
jgi:hypothetical protein